MKPQKLALTQDYVDALTLDSSQSDDVSIYDTQQAGLYVRLRRGGSKTYYTRYQRGRDRPYKIGSTSAYLLEDARHRAYEVLRDAADGKNPKAKRAAVSFLTFFEAAERFIADKRETVRRNTFRGYPRYLHGPYFKPLHKLELASITQAEFVECVDRVAKESKSAAHHARGCAILLYKFARHKGWLPGVVFDPERDTADPLPKKDMKARDRTLSDAELVAVWNAASDPKSPPDMRDYDRITRLVALHGNRREEFARMRWDGLKNGIWHLTAEETKTGEPRDVPLSAAALKVIGERVIGRTYVFGVEDRGFSNWSRCKPKLDDRLLGKMDASWGLHDLRRTMRTVLTQTLDIDRELAEIMIGHIPAKSVRVYEVDYSKYRLADQAKAFEKWAAHVQGLVDGTATRPQFREAA